MLAPLCYRTATVWLTYFLAGFASNSPSRTLASLAIDLGQEHRRLDPSLGRSIATVHALEVRLGQLEVPRRQRLLCVQERLLSVRGLDLLGPLVEPERGRRDQHDHRSGRQRLRVDLG